MAGLKFELVVCSETSRKPKKDNEHGIQGSYFVRGKIVSASDVTPMDRWLNI